MGNFDERPTSLNIFSSLLGRRFIRPAVHNHGIPGQPRCCTQSYCVAIYVHVLGLPPLGTVRRRVRAREGERTKLQIALSLSHVSRVTCAQAEGQRNYGHSLSQSVVLKHLTRSEAAVLRVRCTVGPLLTYNTLTLHFSRPHGVLSEL